MGVCASGWVVKSLPLMSAAVFISCLAHDRRLPSRASLSAIAIHILLNAPRKRMASVRSPLSPPTTTTRRRATGCQDPLLRLLLAGHCYCRQGRQGGREERRQKTVWQGGRVARLDIRIGRVNTVKGRVITETGKILMRQNAMPG